MADWSLATQIKPLDVAAPLANAARIKGAEQEFAINQYKQQQMELGSEARGLQAYVGTAEFPQKWAEATDRLQQRGVLDERSAAQWRNTPSPLALKAIIQQTQDPNLSFRKEEAQREQKNSDRTFGLQQQTAARLADKTPDGFKKQPDGTLAPIPGGPQDPDYLAKRTAATKTPAGETMDDETATFLAQRSLQGDTRALVGLGRGAQGSENIRKIQTIAARLAKEQGIEPTDILNNIASQSGLGSAYRTLGNTQVKFGVAEKAAQESFPIAQEASNAVPRTQWRGLTELIQKGQTQINDPNLKKFLIATDTAVKDYARTINPTGVLRESDIEYARKILSTADSPEAYKAALDQLNTEVGVMHRAIGRQKDELKGGKKETAPSVATPAGKLPAADRFQQLIKQNGGDKAAAYKSMHDEGY